VKDINYNNIEGKVTNMLEKDKQEINNEDFSDIDEDSMDYEDLSAEEAKEVSKKMLEESIKIRESIIYTDDLEETKINYIELRSPVDKDESPLKKKVKELVNKGKYERKDFIEYLDKNSEQARKMINTYPKKKDFKMEEFIM